MRNIVFEITDNEQKVLAHYCMDPQDWIENAVGHLIEQAKDKIFESELDRILEDPDIATMVNDRDSVIGLYNGPLKGNPNG
jgi:hypothetical protein|tara:strand:- start:298 stop:540 length:243 start_codon:yes stop_codon:yes gene_type:complete